jgi:hypothetical protein
MLPACYATPSLHLSQQHAPSLHLCQHFAARSTLRTFLAISPRPCLPPRRSDIEHLAQSLVNKVNECVTAMDDERLARIEAEAKVLKQVGSRDGGSMMIPCWHTSCCGLHSSTCSASLW